MIPSDLSISTLMQKRTPIWTAFITHLVESRSWMTRPSPRVIHLRDLQRFVFNEDYEPQTAPTGEHELDFVTTSGMFVLHRLSQCLPEQI